MSNWYGSYFLLFYFHFTSDRISVCLHSHWNFKMEISKSKSPTKCFIKWVWSYWACIGHNVFYIATTQLAKSRFVCSESAPIGSFKLVEYRNCDKCFCFYWVCDEHSIPFMSFCYSSLKNVASHLANQL